MLSILTLIKTIGEQSPRGRIARGFLANVYDKGAITLVQLLAIPVITTAWGVDGYGLWLMLLTIPTYISLSDLGLGTAAGVVLTQCASNKKYERANVVLQSTILFVMGTVTVAALVALSFAFWFSLNGNIIAPFQRVEVAYAIIAITGYSLVMTQMSIITVVYRSTYKFAFAMTFSGTLILLEGLSLVVLPLFGFGLQYVALAYFLIRLTGYAVFVILLQKKEPWIRIGVRFAQRATIRELANPSVAALGLTFATAISLQGMVLALGISAGPAIVAVFGAARTLSRAPLQLSGMVLRPSIPEMTRAIAEENYALLSTLNRVNIRMALGVSVPFGIAMIVAGPWLLSHLSHEALDANYMLFVLLSIAAVANATWKAMATPLIAINRQAEFSFHYLIIAILAVLFILAFDSPEATLGAVAMVVVEILITIRVWYCISRCEVKW